MQEEMKNYFNVKERTALIEQNIVHTTQMIKELKDMRKEDKKEMRWIFIIMIGGFSSLFGMMAHGFHWII